MNASDTLSAQLQRRRQALDATSREVARLESDRVLAEQAVSVAAGSAATQAEVKLGQIKSAMARSRAELQTHIDALAGDAAVVADRLNAARETVAAKGSALLRATSAEWQQAKAEFDDSLRALAAAAGGDHA